MVRAFRRLIGSNWLVVSCRKQVFGDVPVAFARVVKLARNRDANKNMMAFKVYCLYGFVLSLRS